MSVYEEEIVAAARIRDAVGEVPASDDARAAPGRLELVRQFINTADLEPGEDELTDLAALQRRLRLRRLLRERETLEVGDLERAVEVREALRKLLEDRCGGAAVDARALRALNAHPACVQMRSASTAAARRDSSLLGGVASTARWRSCSRSSSTPTPMAPGRA